MKEVVNLIDTGLSSGDPDSIKNGIKRGKKLLKENKKILNDENKCKIQYYIANGYKNLYDLEFDTKKDYQQIIDNSNLQNSKKYYRESLELLDSFNDDPFKCMVWTNYANLLDDMCRGVEAFFGYEEALKKDPNFSMALMNKAIALKRFANISGAYKNAIYNESYNILNSVRNNEDIVKIGGIEAKWRIEKEIKEIEKYVPKRILIKDYSHKKCDLSEKSAFERFYIKFCSHYNLFLNFHIHDLECEASLSDPIFIEMLVPQEDVETSHNLVKQINQIKEDYVVARLLLVKSLFKTEELDNIGQRTFFLDSEDLSLFNIYTGLLKSAYKDSYSILDKISRFLKDYYDIYFEENIYFTSIWMDKSSDNQWFMKPTLKEKNNPSLFALYDINLDFRNESYQNLRTIRNKLSHEKLIIHDSNWNGEKDKYNLKYDDMIKKTVELLQLTKSAVIYLINCVQIEEIRKIKDYD